MSNLSQSKRVCLKKELTKGPWKAWVLVSEWAFLHMSCWHTLKPETLPRLKILCINNQQKSTIISTLTTTVRTWLGQTHSVLFHPYGDSEQCIYGSEEPAAQRDENQGGRNLHCRGGVGGFWRLLCRKTGDIIDRNLAMQKLVENYLGNYLTTLPPVKKTQYQATRFFKYQIKFNFTYWESVKGVESVKSQECLECWECW